MTNIDQQKLVESLKQIEEDIDNGDLKTAQRGLRDLRTNLDVTAGSANTTIGSKSTSAHTRVETASSLSRQITHQL